MRRCELEGGHNYCSPGHLILGRLGGVVVELAPILSGVRRVGLL